MNKICTTMEQSKKLIELKYYTIDELKEEINRRTEFVRKQKAEERKTALKCRNCKHCVPNPKVPSWCKGNYCICSIRTWGKKVKHNYSVKPFTNACELFERKTE